MINLFSISKNSLLGGLLRFFLKIIPNNAVVPIVRGKLKGKKWVKGSGVNAYWLGNYDFRQTECFEKFLKKGDVVFDIGAHVGFYSLLSAELVGENGEIFSFEPLLENYEYLKKHIKINNYKNIIAFNVAVSDREGAPFFSKGEYAATGRLADSGEIKVNAIAIDDWIKNKRLPVPNVIKIDVEGAEVKVLKGAEATLKKFHPFIFLSVHGEKLKEECFAILRDCGYNLESTGDSGQANKIFVF